MHDRGSKQDVVWKVLSFQVGILVNVEGLDLVNMLKICFPFALVLLCPCWALTTRIHFRTPAGIIVGDSFCIKLINL